MLAIEDMEGGTFSISNGGVFGSLFGTPIINQPQSAILGIHTIKKRPVVVNDQVCGQHLNQDFSPQITLHLYEPCQFETETHLEKVREYMYMLLLF